MSVSNVAPILVTGATVGGIVPRLEINDFVQDNMQFSLYVQAWQMLQDLPQTNLTSHFQIGGIHGRPFIEWDGVTGTGIQNPPWGGYCTHGSVLFPTWHRPYVALIEQLLSDYAQEIASAYTVDPDDWQQAAESFRFPYWDWASNSLPPPEVISLDQVQITLANGTTAAVDNPLRRYTFNPIDDTFTGPFRTWPTTLRWPNSTSPNATDDVDRLRRVLETSQDGITSSTLNMLTFIDNWDQFSNHNSDLGSIEAIHDNIHGYVGGQAHMAVLAYAAFDPIFFLHHANVDRMISLWSAINPGVWVTPGDSDVGSFTLPPGVPVDTNTDLTPFWKTDTEFWKSSDVVDSSIFGYTYPEFLDLGTTDPQEIRSIILDKVNQLYGGVSKEKMAAGQLREWSAHVAFDHSEISQIGSSFFVLFFLGDVPPNPNDWLVNSKMVGTVTAFANNVAGMCPNCKGQQKGQVMLNNGIAKFSGLNSFDAGEINPYLKQNLHWRALKADQTPLDLKSLKVDIYEVPMNLSPGAQVPVPGKPVLHSDITQGRSG